MYSTPRVLIDLNSTDEDGETIVFLSDVTSGSLVAGRMAEAYEPEDGVAAPARVASVYPDRGVAFLQVDWRAMRREAPKSPTFRLSKVGWTESATSSSRVASTPTVTRRSSATIRVRSAQAH